MQNVAWPTMIVQIDRVTPPKLKNSFSAMPVMMPGRARGSTKRRLTASRPKNEARLIAKAAQEPRTSAMAVAARPAWTESSRAVRTLGSFHVAPNHLVVRPGMGPVSYTHLRAHETRHD